MTKKLRTLLKEKELDAILLSDGYNVRYHSGFAGMTGYLFLTQNVAVLLTDSRYTLQAREEAAGCEVREVGSDAGYGEQIGRLMSEEKVRRIGFEDMHIVYGEFAALRKKCPGADWVGLGASVNLLRCVKEPWELERIERAEEIGTLAFARILSDLKPGVTELAVAAKLEYYMKELGADGISFDTIVASGANSAMPHAAPTEKRLEKGDLVTMDFGCRYKGYCSDMTRTVAIGKADKEQRRLYGIVLDAQTAALETLESGKTGDQVDAAARAVIEDAGYGDCFGHGLGHSLGLFIHEEPRLSPRCKTVLRANVPMTAEPGIYLPGRYGVRIEDLTVIQDGGCRNLTNATKELLEL